MKHYNMKAIFQQGKLHKLIFGDFGEAKQPDNLARAQITEETSLLAWPVDPEKTGKKMIAQLLGVEVTDYFIESCNE
jgi:hypothetical protein